MSNFFEFIEKDIEAKKQLLSVMPLNTKPNKKKYVQKIDSINETYENYKEALTKYIEAKREKLEVKSTKGNTDTLLKELENLKVVVDTLNPINTYVEKLGLDDILYEMSNYGEFSFERNAKVIDKFIDKFELSGIVLTRNDFNVTYYVREFMEEFLKLRKTKSTKYDSIKEIFEKIYWNDPKLMEHIELNFRQLIHKYKKNFEQYVSEKQAKLMVDNDIKDYDEAIQKYSKLYSKIEDTKDEDIHDIIEAAKNGTMEISNYFKDSKFRISAYESLSYETLKDDADLEKFYESIKTLKENLIEYGNYKEFTGLYDMFKTKDKEEKKPKNDDKNKDKNKDKSKEKEDTSSRKAIKEKITKLEEELEKINKKLNTDNTKSPFSFLKKVSQENTKESKFESNHLADELYTLYLEYDNKKVLDLIEPLNKKSILISDVIFIINSFNYYRKNMIKNVYKLESYNEVIKKDNTFKKFANNPENVICKSIYCYLEDDVVDNIIKKYRFENIKLLEEELTLESLDSLINKIDFLLRIKKIESSKTSIEDIWFIIEASKISGN